MVVDIANCNKCHDRLALHGSNRLNPQECVFCHNPNGNDGRDPAESIDFKRMIHRIHTGAELTHDYSIGDKSFNGVRFPGDRRDCETCHVARHRGAPRQRAAGPPRDGNAEGLVHADAAQCRRVPRLPRHPGGGRARVHDDGAVRRGLRHLPRSRRRLRGRQGSRSIGAVVGPLLLSLRGVGWERHEGRDRSSAGRGGPDRGIAPRAVGSANGLAQTPTPKPTTTPAAPAATEKAAAASELPKCGECHTDVASAFAANPHARVAHGEKKPDPSDLCSTCHGDGTKHIESGGSEFIAIPMGLSGAEERARPATTRRTAPTTPSRPASTRTRVRSTA